jgi:hypothetical protein
MIKKRMVVLTFRLCLLAGLLFIVRAETTKAISNVIPGVGNCPLFPADNPWNRDISHDPVAANSDAIVNYINRGGTQLGFAFGHYLIYGIPYNVVSGSQPKVETTFTNYAGQSDPGPYPIPPDALVEGLGQVVSDRHLIVVDKDNCILYEMYDAQKDALGWSGKAGAIYNLRSNVLRPPNWTSADAAGLPIFPGLLRYEEVSTGVINHALRFVVANNISQARYIYPARHYQGSNLDPSAPPMGTRIRLKASFDLSRFTGHTRVILEALKKYGMILADESQNSWTLWGTSSGSWDRQNLEQLRQVPGSAFEVVNPQYSSSAIAQASAVTLAVQYKPGNINVSDNQLAPTFEIVNKSEGYGVLPEYTLRYWFTSDGNTSLQAACTYAAVGCANLNYKIVAMSQPMSSANSYLEVAFKSVAGAVYPWKKSGTLQFRITNAAGVAFNESNDYSYSSLTGFMDWSRVTLYRNGALVWGTEPSNNTATPSPIPSVTRTPTRVETQIPTRTPTKTPTRISTSTAATATRTPTRTPTAAVSGNFQLQYKPGSAISTDAYVVPSFNLVNLTASDIPYSEFKIRYWFTRDSSATLSQHCVYAAINCTNVRGMFTAMPNPVSNADHYYDVTFTTTAGVLKAGTQSGEIRMTINKSDLSVFNETNDYSFDGTKTQFGYWMKVAVYRNGVRIWGTEPTTTTSVATFAPPTNTPKP